MRKEALRIAVLGDSISQGLGSKMYNYCDELQLNVQEYINNDCIVENFAYTGTTIKYANKIVTKVLDFDPDIIISFYGNVDAMVRPKTTGSPNYYKLLPKRYKKNGMLDPRPFYSSNVIRNKLEKVDSFIRYHLKLMLINLQGTYYWTELNDFEKEYNSFLNKINNNRRLIFIISTVYVDEKYFPKTNANYEVFNSFLKNLMENEKIFFVDLYNTLRQYPFDCVYGNDHFHPNMNGYSLIAEKISNEIIANISNLK